MSDRKQLNEESLEEIVGGSFTFYTDQQGNPRCYVDNYGKYNTSADGFFKYIDMRNAQPGLTENEYVQIALNTGLIW